MNRVTLRPWRRPSYVVLASLFVVSALGCSGGSRNEKTATGDQKTHAPANVVPGSYEDWCGEHGVAESACTRCNPSLIPAFKATSDWCNQHGLPESQCLACNPGLEIRRPPKPGA